MPETETTPTEDQSKAGARHSRGDTKMLQTIHDHAVSLGAACDEGKALTLPDEIVDGQQMTCTVASGQTYVVTFKAQPVTDPPLDNTLKALSRTEDELIVGNYLALWGGRDLEGLATRRLNPDGSRGEYFTKATEFDSDYTAADTVIVDWEHGFRPDGVGPGKDEPLGRVNWKSAKADATGLFVERVLNRRHRYMKMLEDLIEAGMIGTSSEAIPEMVQKSADGQIAAWPVRRDTLTVNPVEPRMMTVNQVQSLKALAEIEPAIKSAYQRCGIDFPCGESEGDGGPSRSDNEAKAKAAQVRLKAKLLQSEYRL